MQKVYWWTMRPFFWIQIVRSNVFEDYLDELPISRDDGNAQEAAYGQEKNCTTCTFIWITTSGKIRNLRVHSRRQELMPILSARRRQMRISNATLWLRSRLAQQHAFGSRKSMSKLPHCTKTNALLKKSRSASAKLPSMRWWSLIWEFSPEDILWYDRIW